MADQHTEKELLEKGERLKQQLKKGIDQNASIMLSLMLSGELDRVGYNVCEDGLERLRKEKGLK